MKIKIKRMHPEAKLPSYAHLGDVGMDMYSTEELNINPGERKILYCGFALEFPVGYAAIVKDKSGPPYQQGLHTMGGVYDAGFRGEYNVVYVNLGEDLVFIEKGQKIAQLVIFPVMIAKLVEVDELTESVRGDKGFGSTGKF